MSRDVPQQFIEWTRPRTLFLAMFVGLLAGILLNQTHPEMAPTVHLLGQIFVRLTQVIVVPLVVVNIVSALRNWRGVTGAIRAAAGAFGVFATLSVIGGALGAAAAFVFRPGVGAVLELPKRLVSPTELMTAWSLVVTRLRPLVHAITNNDLVAVVCVAAVVGIGIVLVGRRAGQLLDWFDAGAISMASVTDRICAWAPLGVGLALAGTIGGTSVLSLRRFGGLIGTTGVGLALLTAILLLLIALSAVPFRRFVEAMKEPLMTAAATSRYDSALPVAMTNLERLGFPRHVVYIVMPLGQRLSGAANVLYFSVVLFFVAQASGVEFSRAAQIEIVGSVIVGVWVSRDATVAALAGVLVTIGLPIQGLSLFFGIDAFVGMVTASVSVLAGSAAVGLVSRMASRRD